MRSANTRSLGSQDLFIAHISNLTLEWGTCRCHLQTARVTQRVVSTWTHMCQHGQKTWRVSAGWETKGWEHRTLPTHLTQRAQQKHNSSVSPRVFCSWQCTATFQPKQHDQSGHPKRRSRPKQSIPKTETKS